MGLYCVYFNDQFGGRAALAGYVQTRFGVQLGMDWGGGLPVGEHVSDALDAALGADDGQFVVCTPHIGSGGHWSVLMGGAQQCLEVNYGDIVAQLSAASAGGHVLLACPLQAGAWFEYHTGGALQRRWAGASGVLHANMGVPLNSFDADFFGAYFDDDAHEDSDILIELAHSATGISLDDLRAPGALCPIF